MILSVLFGKDQMSLWKVVGILLSLIGCVIAVYHGAPYGEADFGKPRRPETKMEKQSEDRRPIHMPSRFVRNVACLSFPPHPMGRNKEVTRRWLASFRPNAFGGRS